MLLLVAAAPAALGEQASDFTLEDTNPASVRFENPVSPRDYQPQDVPGQDVRSSWMAPEQAEQNTGRQYRSAVRSPGNFQLS